jgi:hypothetical protein
VVAGDEGVMAGHQVGGEVLDVGDLAAEGGHDRRVVLVHTTGPEPLGQQDSRRAASAAPLSSSVSTSGPPSME